MAGLWKRGVRGVARGRGDLKKMMGFTTWKGEFNLQLLPTAIGASVRNSKSGMIRRANRHNTLLVGEGGQR